MFRFGLIILLLVGEYCFSQNSITGIVYDIQTKKSIEAATVSIKKENTFTYTNSLGEFNIPLNYFNDSLIIEHISYKPSKIKINNTEPIKIYLEPINVELQNVIVSGKDDRTSLNTVALKSKDIERLPSFFFENDLIKAIQNQSGVTKANEIDSYIHIRGGGNGNNKYIYNSNFIYNPCHLFGIIGIFNNDAIDNLEVIKNGFNSRLGGALSSYITFTDKIGNKQEFKHKIGVGILSSQLHSEGPIVKDNTSYNFNIRASYFNIISKLYNKGNDSKLPNYNMYDINFNIHSKLSKNLYLQISSFISNDDINLDKISTGLATQWQNKTTSLNLKYYGENYTLKNEFGYSSYSFDLNNSSSNDMNIKNEMNNFNETLELSTNPTNSTSLSFGGFLLLNNYKFKSIEEKENIELKNRETNKDGINYGAFVNCGFSKYNFDLTLSLRLEFFKNNFLYKNISPRINLNYNLNENNILNIAYSDMYQYEHLFSCFGLSLPTDIWYPSDETIKPERSRQISFGLINKKILNLFDFDISCYYKTFDNLIEFKDGFNVMFDEINKNTISGIGESKGIETTIKFKTGDFSGNLAYTLSKTWQKFDGINNGEEFSPAYDIRHVANISCDYSISQNLSLSAFWSLSSGQYLNFPSGVFIMQKFGLEDAEYSPIPIYEKRYNLQAPTYHRLDISLKYILKHSKKRESTFNLSIFNVYNHSNPYFFYFEKKESANNESYFIMKQKSFIPFLPVVFYSLKF